jgi:hypothetical protein
MGGAAMGPMSGAERFVVLIDFGGPKTKAEAEKFNKELKGLVKKHKGKIKVQVTGFRK